MKTIKYFFEFIFVITSFFIFRIVGYKNASNLGEFIGKKIGPIFRSKTRIQKNLENSNIGNSEKEREVIRATLEIYKKVVGRDAKGWLSSSLRSTPKTIDLIAEEGLTFFCDLLNDDQPYLVKTRSGKDIVSVPYTSEVNEFYSFFAARKRC